jgi:ABC-2 type transport system permease protein
VTAYVVGALLLGDAPLSSSVSGTALTQQELAWRTALALGYAVLAMLGVASIALFFSTVTDSPQGAAMGALAFLIASTLLLTLDASQALQPYLPTRYWLAFVDLFRDPILWRDVLRGVVQQVLYVVVFLGAAWANFSTRDITS